MYKLIFLIVYTLFVSLCFCKNLKSTKKGIDIGIYNNNGEIVWKGYNVTSCSKDIENATAYRVLSPNDYSFFIYYRNENIDEGNCFNYTGSYGYFGKHPNKYGKNGERFTINICKRKKC